MRSGSTSADFELGWLASSSGPMARSRSSLGSGIRAAEAIVIGGGDIVVAVVERLALLGRAYLRRPVFVAGVGVPTWRAADARRRSTGCASSSAIQACGSLPARDPESAAWIAANLHPAVPVAHRARPRLRADPAAASGRRGPPIFGVAVRSRRSPTT